MAVLTADDLSELRNAVESVQSPAWVKATLNAASQAIEDRIEGSKAVISSDIDAATSPVVLPNAVKVALVKHYFRQKYRRGG